MDKLVPMLFTTLKSYTKKQFVSDLVAGLIVAVIALPLSIALALASGVGPEEGLYTAIIAGFLISALGGSKVQIAGPTAAFATIVAGIVAESGTDGLMLATLMAGALLILMGLFRFGSLIKYIPYTITTGFTAGIAVTILVGQLKDFFGITYADGAKPIETTEKLAALFRNFSTVNPYAILVGVLCLAILILWPRDNEKVPRYLIAVIVSVLVVKFCHLPVNTIGDLYTVSSDLPHFRLPVFSLSMARSVMPDAFTIAILAAIESLLSCVVADGMTNSKHRSNMELVAQGVGNMGSALFGGIPATGAIARTAANVKNGGKTPVAGMVHAVILLLVLVLLMPSAAMIPMPTIAAILFLVAYNMCQWRPFVHLVKTAPRSDILVLVLTFALTVIFDLVVAIGVGIVLSCLLFMKRMSDETNIHGWKYIEQATDDTSHLRPVPLGVRIFEMEGPLFFGAAGQIAMINTKRFTHVLVLRMRSVPSIDATALNALEDLFERCKKQDVRLVFSHVNEQPFHAMEKAGLVDAVGRENFKSHIEEALDHAAALCEEMEH